MSFQLRIKPLDDEEPKVLFSDAKRMCSTSWSAAKHKTPARQWHGKKRISPSAVCPRFSKRPPNGLGQRDGVRKPSHRSLAVALSIARSCSSKKQQHSVIPVIEDILSRNRSLTIIEFGKGHLAVSINECLVDIRLRLPGVPVRSLALAVASPIAPIVLAVVPVIFTVAGALPDPPYAAKVGGIVDITGTLITGLFRIRAERTAA